MEPPAAGTAWLPRVVAAALLAVLVLLLVQQTADKIDARMVQAGDAMWPGYALELRNDPQPPACDLAAAQQTLATCVQPAAALPGDDPFGTAPGDDPFGTAPGDDPFGTAPGDDPFGTAPGDDPFGTPADAAAPAAGSAPATGSAPAAPDAAATADPFGTAPGDDPFGTPADADPFGTPADADPFGTPADADPFAAPAASGGVSCVAAEALVAQCTAAHQLYEQSLERLTPTVRAWRAVELVFRDLAQFAYGLHLLSIVLILGGLQATWLRAHIALRPVRTAREHQLDQGGQLLAHLLLLYSCLADHRVRAGLEIDVEHVEIPLLWAVGFGLLSAVNLRHLLRPPAGLRPGGSLGSALLAVPLYAWMVAIAGAWFLGVEQHWSGQAIYLHKFAQIPSVYLAVALYVWSGMLLERTPITPRIFDLLRPWKLPVALLAWVVVVGAALPTAYSGASGIFVIAAGAVIFEELRRAGATTQQARMVTAMSGSLGVVLRPCLVVVLIAALNNQVTTDQLYGSGLLVFGLTTLVFLLVLLAWYRPRLSLAAPAEALPGTLRAARRLVPAVLIGAAVIGLYAVALDAPLNERSAPWILPILLLAVLGWERWVGRREADTPTVRAQVARATLLTGEHIGALLFLMAATVGIGGVVERAEIMELVPESLGGRVPTMALLVFVMVLVGMTMDAMGAVILVSVTLAEVAYRNGIDPVHFWMMVLVAFELGYLTPPVALNHLLTRQVVGEAADVPHEAGVSFWKRHEHVILPMVVMGLSLLLVAFGPFLWT